ncbi:MAG: permease-like cell division protein FtsX [Bacilli bacterium]|nr:permease-like cell division protein FtsX [Bacilli bacterium]MBR3049752.1 permease-like cell division protein FtsX [Bacilli bacterium]
MKVIRMLGRSIRDAFKSAIRNFSLSLASISCITITLIIVAIAIIASLNVQNFTKEIEKDLTIVVFLENDSTSEDVARVRKEINDNKNVDTYTFQSKEEVKQKMQQESDVFNTVLDGWEGKDSPLKDTFQVKVKNVKQIAKTAKQIKNIEKVAVVRYGEGMVDKMISAFSSVEKGTYIVVIALIVVTVFLIINTIKLTISARRREIGIMRLVGASNFTIKTPFIIEGMILGVFGSIIPIVFTTYGYTAFYNHYHGHLFSELIKLIEPEPFIYNTSIAVLIIGIIVGMVGSAGAVRKYLKI